MVKYDLSILIPARNEEWVSQTVKNILENKRGKTEVLVGLDGQWASPGIPDHPDVTIIYSSEAIGQRARTNQLCKASTAKYVMKLDAHCALDEGFDIKMMEEMQDNWTMVPALYNLHVFNWKCKKCGNEWYMGAEPKRCQKADTDGNKPEHVNEACDNTSEFEKVLVFKPRLNKRSEFFRFDTDMHFQYHGKRKFSEDAQGDIAETMSIQGSCFMLTRDKYWELDICQEDFGSWGQQGVEVACKTWLSGGRVVVNKSTWYAHMFRTQDGFGFPYPLSQSQVQRARAFSKELFLDNTWPLQIHPLIWLIDKFKPLDHSAPRSANRGRGQSPDWHTEAGKEIYEYAQKKGEEFYKTHPEAKKQAPHWMDCNCVCHGFGAENEANSCPHCQPEKYPNYTTATKGIIYYTDNQLNLKISHAVQKQLKKIGIPIVSASLKPMDLGKNIHMKGLTRGYEAYFRQILSALEASSADIIYICEHDWLYHPSHFEFIPPTKDTFYYNWNWWRVRSSDGHAVKYDTQLQPGMVAYREILVEHYRKVIKMLEEIGFTGENANKIGFEPGTHKRIKEFENEKAERFDSEFPLIDIRHTNNLTASKWSPDAFRNPKNAQGWTENDNEIPGWGKIYGRFEEFLKEI